jgi:hypothetical protein
MLLGSLLTKLLGWLRGRCVVVIETERQLLTLAFVRGLGDASILADHACHHDGWTGRHAEARDRGWLSYLRETHGRRTLLYARAPQWPGGGGGLRLVAPPCIQTNSILYWRLGGDDSSLVRLGRVRWVAPELRMGRQHDEDQEHGHPGESPADPTSREASAALSQVMRQKASPEIRADHATSRRHPRGSGLKISYHEPGLTH